jgi:hypothetical protein
MLGFQDNVVEDQFFRGLSPDNMLEVERIGGERPINNIVDALEKIEKRKSEMRLSLSNKSAQQAIIQKTVTPIQVPPVSAQEPVITKPVASHELSHEQLNRLLKEQAENLTNTFKAQIQALQNQIAQQSAQQAQQVQVQPGLHQDPIKRMQAQLDEKLEDYNRRLDEDGGWIPIDGRPNKMTEEFAIFKRAMEKARKEKFNRRIDDLAGRLAGLNIHDDYDPMDASNLADGSVMLKDGEGNEFICYATRSAKKKQ